MAHETIKFSEKELNQLSTMAGFGLTEEKMALILGVSRSTLQRRMAQDPIVREAVDKGRARASYNIIGKAYEVAMNGNVTMLIYWLRCREGWREEFPDIKGEIPIKIIYAKQGDNDKSTSAPVDVSQE